MLEMFLFSALCRNKKKAVIFAYNFMFQVKILQTEELSLQNLNLSKKP